MSENMDIQFVNPRLGIYFEMSFTTIHFFPNYDSLIVLYFTDIICNLNKHELKY